MSENTEEFSDNESPIDEISDTLDTEDVVNTAELQDVCDIVNLMNNKKIKEIKVVDKSKRISKNQMNKYELVRILGERTAQLTRGAKPLIKQNKKTNSLTYKEIAIEEIKLNMTPLKIKRAVLTNDGYQYEIWTINELRKDHLMNILN
jgi:DNA-directed RNA polymerase subunit K/omega